MRLEPVLARALHDALAESTATIGTGFLAVLGLNSAFDKAVHNAHRAFAQLEILNNQLNKLVTEIGNARADVVQAEGTLNRCLSGQRSESLVAPAAIRPATDCGDQATALGTAQGQATAFGKARTLFAKLPLGKAAAESRADAAAFRKIAAAAAAKPRGAKAAAALRKVAKLTNTGAVAIGKLSTIVHGFAGRAAAAKKRAVAAQSAFTKCRTGG